MEKFIGGILAISPGLFLGREGPSIQLGAVVGQGYSQWRQSTKSEEKILISSGASAGLAAAFNARTNRRTFICSRRGSPFLFTFSLVNLFFCGHFR